MPQQTQPHWRPALGKVAMPLCATYAAGVFALFSLRFLLPVWPPLLLLLSLPGPFLYAPLILLVPLAFVSRARAAIAVVLAAVTLFLVIYVPYFLPRPGTPPAITGSPITIMAYNLGATVSRPDALVAAIGAVDADVVGLEELYPAAATALDQAFTARYPYRILMLGMGGSALLSRYPIVDYRFFQPAGFARNVLHATLDLDGQQAQVFVVHPEPPIVAGHTPGGWLYPRLHDERLEAQLADILARAGSTTEPLLVMGDFNMSDQSHPYTVISSALGDSFREAGYGFGFTFPTRLPVGDIPLPGPFVRIDYIFHSRALYAQQAEVGCQGSSDHCYVVARFGRVTTTGQP